MNLAHVCSPDFARRSVGLGLNGSSLSVSWLANDFPMRISPVLPVVRLDAPRRHNHHSPRRRRQFQRSPPSLSGLDSPVSSSQFALERAVLAKLGVVTECTVSGRFELWNGSGLAMDSLQGTHTPR